MKADLFLAHISATRLSRRAAAKLGAAAGGAATLAALGARGAAATPRDPIQTHSGVQEHRPYAPSAQLLPEPINDEPFDAAAVERGAWAPGPYGAGDERGTFNEVTPEKTAAALRLLDSSRPVRTYNLGEMMFEGFPAFPSAPNERVFKQTLVFGGMVAPPGIIQLDFGMRMPAGANRVTYMEERLESTFQIATQLDGLNHIGVGDMYYNGFRASQIARANGTSALDNSKMGPIVTRGIVLDIVGLKRAQGQMSALDSAANGESVLTGNYRITVEDIEAALARQGIAEPGPGDAVIFYTGWTHLVAEPMRYLASEPGIFLREARWLAVRRPALVASDTFGLEVLDPAVTQGLAFPVHQVLITRNGIRIGEGFVTTDLVRDGVFEFVFIVTPQNAMGGTCGNTPPAALGQARP